MEADLKHALFESSMKNEVADLIKSVTYCFKLKILATKILEDILYGDLLFRKIVWINATYNPEKRNTSQDVAEKWHRKIMRKKWIFNAYRSLIMSW